MRTRKQFVVVWGDVALANEASAALGKGEPFGNAKLCTRESGLGPPSHARVSWLIEDEVLTKLVGEFDARGVRYEIRDDPRGERLEGSVADAHAAVADLGFPQTVHKESLARMDASEFEAVIAKVEDAEACEWVKDAIPADHPDKAAITAAVDAKTAEIENAEVKDAGPRGGK